MAHRDEEKHNETLMVWTAPTVRRLSAGSAEDGGGDTPDGGQPS